MAQCIVNSNLWTGMKNLNYNPTAPVTINSFRTLLSEWDREDPLVLNVLAGMMMLLRHQGLGTQVDDILDQEFTNI